jgi:hypothetical protein
MQSDTPEHETQNSCPVGASGFGLGTFDQPDPDAAADVVTSITLKHAEAMNAGNRFIFVLPVSSSSCREGADACREVDLLRDRERNLFSGLRRRHSPNRSTSFLR